MKLNLVFFLIIIMTSVNLAAINNTITGEVITGEVTAGDVGIGINLSGLAAIQINSPTNGTYPINEIQLDVTSGAPSIEYEIDNLGMETLLENGKIIALGVGPHNITFFATNDFGTANKTVYFSINGTIFEVLYSNFSNSTKTTKFVFLTFDEMQAVENIVLDISEFGKIEFYEIINITDDRVKDKLLDLDSNVNILHNEIFLDSSNLPNFNKKAILTFYNANFKNPMLLRDGGKCETCILINHSYFEKLISYNVPGFSKYNLIETPEEVIEIESGGSGGGAGLGDLELQDTMNIIIMRGQVKNGGIPIKNSGSESLHLFISSDLKELIKFKETEYLIRAGESSLILLDFFAEDDFPIGIYTGKIFLDFQNRIKEVFITIEVKSPSAAFDVDVKIPNRYKKITIGENILTQTQIWNFKKDEEIDIKLKHVIKDIEGKEITSFEKLLTVKTQLNFIDEIFLPNLKPGKYFVHTQISHENIYSSSSDEFIVTRAILKDNNKLLILLIIGIIILAIIILLLMLYKRRRYPKRLLRRIYKHKYG